MSDFFEIDFLNIESSKSGDAIGIRYTEKNIAKIHIVDGGFQATGEKLIKYINQHYDNPPSIDYVVVTHPDGDHAGGLRSVLDEFDVKELWMLRPWLYAEQLIERFKRFSSVENLTKRLKEIYPNIKALEDIAIEKGIPIKEPFQGSQIGEFTVLAPSIDRYLELIIESEKTPESHIQENQELTAETSDFLSKAFDAVVEFVKALWGDENFSSEETSSENEMSVVQYASLSGQKVILTGDAGRAALTEAADYAPLVGCILPGVDNFQVPHHGSRRNLSSELLNTWVGEKLDSEPGHGNGHFSAIISASEEDKHHPRKTVVRALIHRGANVMTTEKADLRIGKNAPERNGWSAAPHIPYPDEMEGN